MSVTITRPQTRTPAETQGPDEELEATLAEFTVKLSNSDISAAQRLSAELEARWPDSPRVQQAASILKPPKVVARAGTKLRSMEKEHAWLRAHAAEYPGCWIALIGDQMIAAEPELGKVLAKAGETPGGDTALRRDTSIVVRAWEDDVSGIASMIELSRMLSESKLKSNNYLFVAFSGEEQGAFGSKYLAGHLPFDAKQLNYMLDLDKYDPSSDSSHRLIIGQSVARGGTR